VGVVDVPEIKDIRPILNPHLGGVQVVVGWEVQVAPLGASRWDRILGAHPRGQ
jgi:hypothetical protein